MTKITKRQKLESVSPALIEEIFNFWVESCKSTRGPKPVMSEKRQILIACAIIDYGTETCKDAIHGCSISNWHMGQNPQGKKYNDIELIFRDSQKIENFAELGQAERTKGGFLEEK